MIEVLALDWDGVFVQTMQHVYVCTMEVCKCFGLPVMSFDRWYESNYQPYMTWYYEHGLPKSVTEDVVNKIYLAKHAEFRDVELQLVDGILDLVREAHSRNIPIYIVSAHDPDDIESRLVQKKLRGLITGIYGHSTNKAPILESLALTHCCMRKDVALLGDLRSDIIDARTAMATAIGLAATENMVNVLAEEKAHFIFRDPREVIPFLTVL